MKETTPVAVIEWAEDDPPLTIANLHKMRHQFLRRFGGRYAEDIERPLLLVYYKQMDRLMHDAELLQFWFPGPAALRPTEILGFVVREVR